jgi:death-on-curing protein
VDGNKRIGVHAMLVFLALNGVELSYRQEELVSLGLSLASGVLSCDEVLQWIMHHQG